MLYFPLISCLEAIFRNHALTKLMIWHKDHRSAYDVMNGMEKLESGSINNGKRLEGMLDILDLVCPWTWFILFCSNDLSIRHGHVCVSLGINMAEL